MTFKYLRIKGLPKGQSLMLLNFVVALLSFKVSEQKRKRSDENEIEGGGVEKRPYHCLTCKQKLCFFYDLNYHDHTGKSGILDKRDYFVTHRRDNTLEDLLKSYPCEYLELGHAEYKTGFGLTYRHSFNTCSEDL